MNASTIISTIMDNSDSFSVAAVIGRTSRRNYKIFKFKVADLLNHHSLIDIKTICRYDLDQFVYSTVYKNTDPILVSENDDYYNLLLKVKKNNLNSDERYNLIRYAAKYGAVKVLKWLIHNKYGFSERELVIFYKYRYSNQQIYELLPKCLKIKVIEDYYNNTIDYNYFNLFRSNFSNFTSFFIIKHAFKHNYVDDIKIIITTDHFDHNAAFEGIIEGKNYKLLKYILPKLLIKNYRRKLTDQTIINWLNKYKPLLIPNGCICNKCTDMQKFTKEALNKLSLNQALCFIKNNKADHQDIINYLFEHGKSKEYLYLKNNNHVYTGKHTITRFNEK